MGENAIGGGTFYADEVRKSRAAVFRTGEPTSRLICSGATTDITYVVPGTGHGIGPRHDRRHFSGT